MKAGVHRPNGRRARRRIHICAGVLLLACREKEVEHEGRPISYWVQQMTNPDSAVRHQAVAAFAHDAGRSPEAARALLEVLSDEREADVHATIADALGTLGPNLGGRTGARQTARRRARVRSPERGERAGRCRHAVAARDSCTRACARRRGS
jgi:hypothetical protein